MSASEVDTRCWDGYETERRQRQRPNWFAPEIKVNAAHHNVLPAMIDWVGEASATLKQVGVGLPTRYPAQEVLAFLTRDDVVSSWLCPQPQRRENVVLFEAGQDIQLPSSTRDSPGGVRGAEATVQTWRVLHAGWRGDAFRLDAVREADNHQSHAFALTISPRPGDRSHVRLRESGLSDDAAVRTSLSVWQAALNRLAALLKAAERARRGVRQAIVVVHGIGEQRPGQTSRDFTGALFGDSMVGGDASIHLKPDLLSPLYDMHMYRVRGDLASQRPPTDVYELYWANLMRDTTLGQVVRWVIPLFFAPNKRITPTLLKHVWGLRLLVILIVAAAGWTWRSGTWSAAVSALGAVGLLALAGAAAKVAWEFARDKFVISYVGDAARYLEPTPDNIERRQEIRSAGVDLLERLHDEGAYQRIIVVGHSLGSVIAYDVLSATWIRRGRQNEYAKRMKSKALVAAEDLLNPRDPSAAPPTSSEIRARQYAAWHEYRRNGFDWRVSDFVTLGSPLAHARLLLNLDKTSSFDELVANRSLPTCPPQVEWRLSPKPGVCRKVFSFTHAYRDERYPWHTSSVQVPHYAGLFALTRWSNLYFPLRGVLGGDPVGGALQATFGHWIDDIEVENPKPGPFGFAHTLYWTPSGFSSHIVRLRAALALPYATTLEDLSPPSPETLAQVRD